VAPLYVVHDFEDEIDDKSKGHFGDEDSLVVVESVDAAVE